MKDVIMKKLLFWIVLIVGTVALLGSCAKKEESTTAAAAASVCTTCDPLTSTTTAAGSITVGSATLSGTYATSCFTNASSLTSSGSASSDIKSYGFLFIVRGNDNVTEETNYYTDSICSTKGYTKKNVYDNVTVGSASGSNYQVALMYKQIKILVTTTVSEAWVDGIYGGSVDFVVDTEKILTVSASSQQKYNLWNVSATTFEMGNNGANYSTELTGVKYTKQ